MQVFSSDNLRVTSQCTPVPALNPFRIMFFFQFIFICLRQVQRKGQYSCLTVANHLLAFSPY